MDAVDIFASEPLNPETTRLLAEVFEGTWCEIAQRYEDRPIVRDQVRLRLAEAILSMARDGVRDPVHIKESALLILAMEESNLR